MDTSLLFATSLVVDVMTENKDLRATIAKLRSEVERLTAVEDANKNILSRFLEAQMENNDLETENANLRKRLRRITDVCEEEPKPKRMKMDVEKTEEG